MKAIKTALERICNLENLNTDKLLTNLEIKSFTERINELALWVNSEQPSENIENLIYDLFIVSILSENSGNSDFFDSAEWLEIEESTLTKGSEILNLFLYINDCIDAETKPDLEDFLNEFMLTDMDEFQDEFIIYEPMISNQEIIDADVDTLIEIKKHIKDDSEIKHIFIPICLFLTAPTHFSSEIEKMNDFEAVVYESLFFYHKDSLNYL